MLAQQTAALDHAPAGGLQRRVDVLGASFGFVHHTTVTIGAGSCGGGDGGLIETAARHDLGVAAGRDRRGRRSGRIFSRPAGSLRWARIRRKNHRVHRDPGLLALRHTYLFAH